MPGRSRIASRRRSGCQCRSGGCRVDCSPPRRRDGRGCSRLPNTGSPCSYRSDPYHRRSAPPGRFPRKFRSPPARDRLPLPSSPVRVSPGIFQSHPFRSQHPICAGGIRSSLLRRRSSSPILPFRASGRGGGAGWRLCNRENPICRGRIGWVRGPPFVPPFPPGSGPVRHSVQWSAGCWVLPADRGFLFPTATEAMLPPNTWRNNRAR
mmetsp:Transcript_34540/g.81436  ORF Transcript_34540/g.81436 Transcript_34540/m.81436 type:complete len:208 (+) Transcript_34540:299-922(+)